MTRQRRMIADILESVPQRHLTADDVMDIAQTRGLRLSLATVYNTLNQFVAHGLLRRVATARGAIRFDTTPGDHHHFQDETSGQVTDIAPGNVCFSALPEPPPGYRIAGVDVVVRIEPAADEHPVAQARANRPPPKETSR
ncbi:transcriptional repressor [Rhodobacteraceae bacterium F11138]|nr:transcriptional repressor [Rhodobacteraceae bacterium F11138]